MATIVLFDIDETLLRRKRPDSIKFQHSIEKIYGISGEKIDVKGAHGMTDQQIIIDTLKNRGFTERAIKSRMEECKSEMVSYYKKNIGTFEFAVFDGAKDLLYAMKQNKIPTGIVTGNMEEIARMKLRKAGLDKFFTFGGFGSDAVKRSDVVKTAIKRARNKFGTAEDVFVIGDSPRDIEAGKAARVKTIGVANGAYSQASLRRCSPDYVLPNLRNTNKIMNIILGV